MSTIASAVFSVDDDNNDADFVPEEQLDNDEDEIDSDTSPQKRENKTKNEGDMENERAKKEAARASLWASFQSSVSSINTNTSPSSKDPPRLVKIIKTHRFAGENVTEIVEVPEDSVDARKWPKWQPSTESDASRSNLHDLSSQSSAKPPASLSAHLGKTITDSQAQSPSAIASSSSPHASTAPLEASNLSLSSASNLASTSGAISKPQPRPGPRKPRTTLLAAPTAASKKLTILQKSALDWRAHVQGTASGSHPGSDSDSRVGNGDAGSQSLADELERNRRGGGYLERVAFLDRVGARREELFEEGRSKRRRKG